MRISKAIEPIIMICLLIAVFGAAIACIKNDSAMSERAAVEKSRFIESGEYTNFYKAPAASSLVASKTNPEIYTQIAFAAKEGKRSVDISPNEVFEGDMKTLREGGYHVERVVRGYGRWRQDVVEISW